MTSCSYTCIMWISVCVGLLSAEPEISVFGPSGSTAVLPCELTSVDTDMLYIRWGIESEIVFERLDEKTFQGEGYEGRVDVPEEELRKGNCSLVLHNLTLTDTGVYTSYQAVRHTMRSARVRRGTVLINSVNLSVYETPRGISPAPTGDAVMKSPHPLILVLSLVSCLLVQKHMFCRETCVTYTENYTQQLCVMTNQSSGDTSLPSNHNCPNDLMIAQSLYLSQSDPVS